MVASGKGLLAADESTGTIGKRFAGIHVENIEANRQNYRQLLFTADGIEKYISGVIMYEETLFQSCDDGTSFVDLLKSKGIVPGIKVDKGVKPLTGTPGETVTQGIDDLDVRCKKYYEQGARFAKWRGVLHIKDTIGATPSNLAIMENANTLARYAVNVHPFHIHTSRPKSGLINPLPLSLSLSQSICQANGLVPIVEPEVMMEGDFGIETAAAMTERVLAATYKALSDHHVMLEGTILKPNFCRSGSGAAVQATPQEIALATARVLQHTLPVAVPGVTFLSGGMTEDEATLSLNYINQAPGPRPWSLTFSYGRALQASCLKAWMGKRENTKVAQDVFIARAEGNSRAQLGKFA